MQVAPAIELTPSQHSILRAQARSRSLPARVEGRSRIVLLAAAGKQDKEIARLLHLTPKKGSRWRKRFLQLGLVGLEKDAPRARKKTQNRPPYHQASSGDDHAPQADERDPLEHAHHGTGNRHQRGQRTPGLAGLRSQAAFAENFQDQQRSRVAEKLEDIVGLYLNPPEHTLVLCVDEK
jgi:hypothetical protein